jgi:hypothetical protein
MTYKEALSFIGKSLTLGCYPERTDEIRSVIRSGSVIWEMIVSVSTSHFVFPALYLQFKRSNLLSELPADLVFYMEEFTDLNRQRNLQLIEQATELTALLNLQGISPVFLKGTAHLFDGLYDDIAERMIGDIDFLVTEKDLIKASDVMMNQGYLTVLQIDGVDILPHDHHHLRHFTKKDEPAVVEIHRNPVGGKPANWFTSEMVFAERKSIPGVTNIFVPSDKHKFIHNFIHCQLSNSGHRHWHLSLRNFYDGYLLSKKVNASEVLDVVEEKTKVRVFYYLINRTFNLKENTIDFDDVKVKRYITIFDWWLDHPELYDSYFKIISFFHVIVGGYLIKIVKSVYSKTYRRYIWIRIKNPEWYKKHFLLLKKKLF